MSEKELWQLIRRNVPGHLLRIENLIGAGIPDSHLTHKGRQVWLELKIGKGNNVQFQITLANSHCNDYLYCNWRNISILGYQSLAK